MAMAGPTVPIAIASTADTVDNVENQVMSRMKSPFV
jgi:hypothetical protein